MVLTLYIYLFVMFPLALSNFRYPQNWEDVCEIFNTDREGHIYVNINCYLTGDDQVHLELQKLNTYTRSQAENVSYSVNIHCSPGGNLTMAWPMKIERLVKLDVVGCTILEHYKDWNNSALDSTGDTLQYLSIINCNILLDPLVLLQSLQNVGNTSREWTCHHDTTLKKMVYRNKTISFLIPKDLSTTKSLMSLDQVNVVNDLLDNKPVCKYTNLEKLEETYVKTLSAYHFVLFEEKAEFPRLKFINYSHVGLRGIPDVLRDWRLRFRHLEYLDLSYNSISDVQLKNGFDVISENDTIIDVSNNNITNISIKTLTEWADLAGMFINIINNPLDCSCLKHDFISDIQKEGFFVGKLSKYEYIREMTCASPESAKGKILKSLTTVDMGCELPPADLTVPLIVVAVIAVSNIICIIIIVKYRKEIKILLYTRFGILFPWDVDDKKELKQYDAFVSYSSEDEDWVYDNLQVNLEQPTADNTATFKLCLHQRDLIGGISILDNIIDSIENSRHSIVVLSHNFISSMWGMEEFRQAYYQSIVKKHRHLIIVKYGVINEHELDPMLKRCLKTFTYLDANDKMFLDRLRFALAIKTRHSKAVPDNFGRQMSDTESKLDRTKTVDSSNSPIISQISRQSDDSGCELDSVDRSSGVCDISDNGKIPQEHIV